MQNDPYDTSKKNRSIIILVGVVIVVVGIAMLVAHNSSKNKKITNNTPNSSAYNTGNSGGDTSTPPTAQAPQRPDFVNTDAVTNVGITQDQLTAFKYEAFLFIKQNNLTVKTVTIDKGSVSTPPNDPDNPASFNTVYFNTTFDATMYRARLDGSNTSVSTARLYLYNSNNQVIYDSGNIDIQSQTPQQ